MPQPQFTRKSHPLYQTWTSMRSRCINPNKKDWKNYGGRGITVCPRWDDFYNFAADMKERPPGAMLERIDNNLGYFPENCTWATRKEQNRNKRNIKEIEFNGETKLLSDWAEELGLDVRVLWRRIHQFGWPLERALTSPKSKHWSRHKVK